MLCSVLTKVRSMVRSLNLDGRIVSDDTSPYVIAEVGHNHQGNLDKALQLIRAAAACRRIERDAISF